MATENIGVLAGKVYDLIHNLDRNEQLKVFNAVFALCGLHAKDAMDGEDKSPHEASGGGSSGSLTGTDATKFFANKDPKTKMEALAVAARFRETVEGATEHSKKDFATIFSTARRNFDASNYPGDMRNAKNLGLFVKGGNTSHKHKLSYAGQNFVDNLPDREKAAAQLKKPKKKNGTKVSRSK